VVGVSNDRAATEKKAIFQSTHNQTEPSLDGEAVIKALKNFGSYYKPILPTKISCVSYDFKIRLNLWNKNISANFQYSEGL